MSKITIPPRALQGFIEIASLTSEQAEKVSTFLRQMQVGTKFNEINEYLYSSLNIKTSRSIVNTFSTFGEILEPTEINFEDLTNNLIESVVELTKKDKDKELDEDKLKALKRNLLLIFENSKNLKLTLKAFKLEFENDNLYSDARIISDIRLIFNDELEDTKRNGIILHRLHINFKKKRVDDEMFFTLDLKDLKNLKEDIDRAIKKEEIIKSDYNKNINFI